MLNVEWYSDLKDLKLVQTFPFVNLKKAWRADIIIENKMVMAIEPRRWWHFEFEMLKEMWEIINSEYQILPLAPLKGEKRMYQIY